MKFEKKQEILALGLDKIERQAHRDIFKAQLQALDDGSFSMSEMEDSTTNYNDLVATYGDDFLLAHKINTSYYKRVQRVKKHNTKIINTKSAIFLTLTFTDDVLKNTSSETRRKYVRRFLKDQCSSYVANIDFGKENDREHYHALCVPSNELIDGSEWSYGIINFKRIRNQDADLVRTSKYIAKLTHHAMKNHDRDFRIIYSRT